MKQFSLLVFLCLLSSSNSFPKTCCTDQSGVEFTDCTCLKDNILQRNIHLVKGKSHRFHWTLTDLNLANIHDNERATVKVHTMACWGEMATHVKGFALDFPTRTTAWYTQNGTNGHTKLKFPFAHSNYLVTVESVAGGNFSIVATTKHNLVPIPGQQGKIELKQISQNAIEVKWVAADSLFPVNYQLYYNLFNNHERVVNVTSTNANVCQERGTAMGPCKSERAIMNTPCGCRRNGILVTTIGEDGGEVNTEGAAQAATSATIAKAATTTATEAEAGGISRRALVTETKSGTTTTTTTTKSNAGKATGKQTMLGSSSGSTPSSSSNGAARQEMTASGERVYRAVITDLPLNVPIFVNVLVVPIKNDQFELAYHGSSASLSFDRVVSAFDATMVHVYIAAGVYGIVGILLLVASVQRSRIYRASTVWSQLENEVGEREKVKDVH